MVHANVRYSADNREVRSVLVTSGTPGDGKTTIAWNVAVAAAETGGRVLFIETDLRHPQIAERLHAGRREGLVDILRGKRAPADVIHQVPIADGGQLASAYALNGKNGGSNGHAPNGSPPVATMDVVFAGRAMSDPRGLLASPLMGRLIRFAEREYDLVVIDTPPAAVIADAVPLLRQVSGVLVVVRLTGDSRDASVLLSEQLRNLKANILGIVINAVEPQDSPYGVAYGYAREYASV
jgi:Mrp family chromosome partitioning ATPase